MTSNKCKNCGHDERDHKNQLGYNGCLGIEEFCDCKQFTPSEQDRNEESIPLERDKEEGCFDKDCSCCKWKKKEGCGNKYYSGEPYICGKGKLCPSCSPHSLQKGLTKSSGEGIYTSPRGDDSGSLFIFSDKIEELVNRCKRFLERMPDNDFYIGKIQGIRAVEYEFEEFIRLLKEDWRIKARKMEIMSGEVAIYELECLLKKRAGDLDVQTN